MSAERKPTFDRLRLLARFRHSVRKRKLFRRFGQQWNTNSDAFQNRRYDSYEAYLEHQKAKLETHEFGNYDSEFRKVLRDRLAACDVTWQGRTVLCLGARIGTEVKAFLDLGCFAIGIDLNPGKGNRYVVHGDFHDLPFAPNSVDVVYTNSLDHAYDVNRIANEVIRVLKSDGMFILEAVQGSAQGVNPGFFESFFWKDINALIRMLENAGFTLIGRSIITNPWPGEAISFRPATR